MTPQYRCDRCGRTYGDPKLALECEDQHAPLPVGEEPRACVAIRTADAWHWQEFSGDGWGVTAWEDECRQVIMLQRPCGWAWRDSKHGLDLNWSHAEGEE